MKLSDPTLSDNVPPTEWMLQQAQSLANSDIFAARSWLLTAKSLFPNNFTVLYEAYKLEYGEKNAKQCASLLSEMLQEFSHESTLWHEIEMIVTALENKGSGNDKFKQDIFGFIPNANQQRMITICADRQTDISLKCKMTLILTQKYPSSVVKYGIPLAERLVDEEKVQGGSSPLNYYRRLLVCEVLPIICKNMTVEISHKHFYKWLQKAAEFYATYFTTDTKIASSQIGKLDESWEKLEALRKLISIQCDWEPVPGRSSTLQDRINHIKDLHKKSRTDLTGKINKKQIFYTAILILIEAAIKYMEMLESHIYNDRNDARHSYVLLMNWKQENTESEKSSLRGSDIEIREQFLVARDAWNILHSNDSFEKDFSHLYRRWKIEKWTWFQLFLSDHFSYEKDHKSSLTRINNLMEQDVSHLRHPILLRCHCQLVSSYFTNGHLLMACQSIMECLSLISDQNPSKAPATNFDLLSISLFPKTQNNTDLILVPLSFSTLLPFWIHIFISSFAKVMETGEDDAILGHMLVLCQHDWPKWQTECRQALDLISKKKKFTYTLLFDYIICLDILEEIAFLKNNSEPEMILLSDAPSSHQRITRGVNKGASEDFKKAMKRQVRKSDDCMETLLKEFLIKEQDSILNCLQSQTSQEILEPMDIDI
ncbi:integrator complex subunit 10-like [Styela clava]